MTLLSELKDRTADIHDRLESKLTIFDDDFSLADYRELLNAFYGFYRPCEERMKRALQDDASDLEDFLHDRLKTPALVADVRTLSDGEDAPIPDAVELPEFKSRSHILGAMYVMEGATLGGAVIAKHLRRRFGPAVDESLNFFTIYGERTGSQWSAFRDLLSIHDSPGVNQTIIASAVRTFECLERHLRLNIADTTAYSHQTMIAL
ncbi:MAG: biliverdin-producing heme oxygenase [Pirellulales bacterium]